MLSKEHKHGRPRKFNTMVTFIKNMSTNTSNNFVLEVDLYRHINMKLEYH